jgi:hypothetical protein
MKVDSDIVQLGHCRRQHLVTKAQNTAQFTTDESGEIYRIIKGLS